MRSIIVELAVSRQTLMLQNLGLRNVHPRNSALEWDKLITHCGNKENMHLRWSQRWACYDFVLVWVYKAGGKFARRK
jgi:hypothetical protein